VSRFFGEEAFGEHENPKYRLFERSNRAKKAHFSEDKTSTNVGDLH
jgi:hypothetical protein